MVTLGERFSQTWKKENGGAECESAPPFVPSTSDF
jgi:hypothetical protein